MSSEFKSYEQTAELRTIALAGQSYIYEYLDVSLSRRALRQPHNKGFPVRRRQFFGRTDLDRWSYQSDSASVARWEGPNGGKFGTTPNGNTPTTHSAQSQAVAEHGSSEQAAARVLPLTAEPA